MDEKRMGKGGALVGEEMLKPFRAAFCGPRLSAGGLKGGFLN
jgi:hypothetical protein